MRDDELVAAAHAVVARMCQLKVPLTRNLTRRTNDIAQSYYKERHTNSPYLVVMVVDERDDFVDRGRLIRYRFAQQRRYAVGAEYEYEVLVGGDKRIAKFLKQKRYRILVVDCKQTSP